MNDVVSTVLLVVLSFSLGFLSGQLYLGSKWKKNLKKLVGKKYNGKSWDDLKPKD